MASKHSTFLFFMLLALLLLYFCASSCKEKPDCPEAIVAESGRTYTPGSFGDSVISGCMDEPNTTWILADSADSGPYTPNHRDSVEWNLIK